MMHWSLLVIQSVTFVGLAASIIPIVEFILNDRIACGNESRVWSVILGLLPFINCLTGFVGAQKGSRIMMLGYISILFIVIIAMIRMTIAMAVVISNNPSRLHVEEVDKRFELKDLFVPLLGNYIADGRKNA